MSCIEIGLQVAGEHLDKLLLIQGQSFQCDDVRNVGRMSYDSIDYNWMKAIFEENHKRKHKKWRCSYS